MSQSPYVFNDKQTRQPYADQTGAPNIAGYSNTQTVYAQYPQRQQGQQQQQQQQGQQQQQQQPQQQQNPQLQQQQQSPVQQQTRAFTYSASNASYPQYDQSQGAVYPNYGGQPIQQFQNLYQQPNTQIPQPGYGAIPASSSSTLTATSGPSTSTTATSNIGFSQPNYLANPYQMNPNAYPAPGTAYGYGYPAGIPMDQSHLAGTTSGSNINMANIRGPLQSATNPPLIDPNQVPQRPKLTTTFWEDEGTVCYQVESRGISVSRREDTNFINGTKLLNVAGMTRGRRDGILKSEKVRYVVKIGAMNLKGVWIPFERALELARNEGIVDLLYPLFVKDIKELYQGPQFSGGLTAAANQNPKNIIPVQVTNTTYIPHVYASREKKKPIQVTTATANQDQLDTSQTQTQPPQATYAYSYPYGTSQETSQYGAPSQDASHYKPNSYYGGYQAPPGAQSNTSKSNDGTDKVAEDSSEKR